ncbi:MAG TPA: T9SS type A sorting domain-containing protein [Bacteroidia bacterium]|nr:T9SS type A sorting domain-containing protein [Bacteroidia bacterium]
MKKFILFALLVFSVSLCAQPYQKMLAGTINTFNVVNLGFLAKPVPGQHKIPGCVSTPVSANWGLWQASGDTIYKNKTYRRIYGNGILAGIMREDTLTRKIYFRAFCDTTNEDLLYDFSLPVGGNITYNFPFSTAGLIVSGTFTVDSIKYLHDYANLYHRHFYLSNHSTNSNVLEMVEGIGNVNHPLFLYYWFTHGILKPWTITNSCPALAYSELLSCKSDDGTRVYYDSTAFYLANGGVRSVKVYVVDTCDYSSICCTAGSQEFSGNTGFYVFPNPVTNVLNCATETITETELIFSLVNSLGQEIKKFPVRKSSKGKNEFSFTISDIENGIYFLTLTAGAARPVYKVISIQR